MEISKLAHKMSEENDLSPDINQAYINLVGEEYASADGCSEAYQGEFKSDEDFAENMADELGLLNREMSWPYDCIDWEKAARELMYDYSEESGYYFRNL